MATFGSAFKSKVIYVYAIADEQHKDCLKIGDATVENCDSCQLDSDKEALELAANKRIREQTRTAGIHYQLLHVESAVGTISGIPYSFRDHQVHRVLDRSGVKRKEFDGAAEWFCCDLETAKKAIAAAKNGQDSLKTSDISHGQNSIIFRPEQREAIDKTLKRFKKGNSMLWYAKMRFGKTLSALQVVKESCFTRTLILTHRPVVNEGWFEDFHKIFYDSPTYQYGSIKQGETFDNLEKSISTGGKYVYFASMQDLRGSEKVGGKFDKNSKLFSTPWDLLIVDEAHEGTQTELGKNVVKELTKATTKVLQLSGTPFNLLNDYSEEDIFTWDYVMEQKAKMAWETDNPYQPNPYISLPAINIYTYDLGNLMSEFVEDEKAFNFREFFRTKENDTFIHNRDVDNFLNLLCKKDDESLYPYSTDEFQKTFRHTLWVVPGVKAAKALSAKLKEHDIFGKFKIVNVAGNGDEDEENTEALKMVNEAIGPDSDETFTITLSCGRLTTGVSIKPWTAVFMMAGSYSTSAAQYMQTIFRVQTPYTNHGRMKEQCYAFDFAPDRTLRVLAETAKVSAKAGKQTDEDRQILGDFLNFCPIISIEGSKMNKFDVDKMMGQLKKAQIEKVVQCGFEDGALYNDELLKLTDVDIKDFQELKGIIGTTKSMGKTRDIDINNQGYDNEQYNEIERLKGKPKNELTDEEKKKLEEDKKKHDNRRNAISILRGISIRMPLLIYGAELKNEEEEITINNFASLIDSQSWEEFMPKDVTKAVFNKFKKYYDPDIFREAGKRIRAMAKAADKFTIEERIERISAIFNTFRNPDKETVLTPWRVVNMHMSDCLGGWCFYDEEFKQTLAVPRFVDQGKVTKDVFRPESHILEINSKSGLYPLYVAYNIYRSRVETAKAKYGEVSHGFAMNLWDATIEENILVVCKTPMAKSITKRTLAGFRNTKVNAQYYPNLIENISECPEAVVNTFRDGKRFWKINQDTNMKIDAIVGNPPYQVNVGEKKDNYGILIFNKFVSISIKMKPNYVSMIFPSRWFTGGRGLDEFRSMMLNDDRIRLIRDFLDAKDLFPTADIAGGINYMLWDKTYHGLCNYGCTHLGSTSYEDRKLNEYTTFIRRNAALDIIKKISKDSKENIESFVSTQTPFGFVTTFRGSSSYFEGALPLLSSGGISYVKRDEVKRNPQWIDSYKVIFSKATCEHAGTPDKTGRYRVFSTMKILKPKEICTQSYLVGGVFGSLEEANNYLSYLKTCFVRFLILQLISTQDISAEKFRFVPLQDFTHPWTDADLYAKYGLTGDEIAFIESMIKPME